MCQCILFDCCWVNCCGQICGGCNLSYCMCSAWCLKPQHLKQYDDECCHFMDFDGWGSNWFICGAILFASEAVKEWSEQRRRVKMAQDQYKEVQQDKEEKTND